jgi:hypothetical protein
MSESGHVPTMRKSVSSARGSRKRIGTIEEQKRNIDLEQVVSTKSLSPRPYNQEDEIRAIMDGANSPVVEEIENDDSEKIQAITLYDESKDVSQIDKTHGFSKLKPTYSQEDIDEIIEENKKLKENEQKYLNYIDSLKSKLKQQKRKTTEANSNKVNYFANKTDLEEFFLE